MWPFPFFCIPNYRYGYGANHYCPNENTYKDKLEITNKNLGSSSDHGNQCTPLHRYKINSNNDISNNKNETSNSRPIYNDDLIILALLFFLYNEKVNDTYLFIALIMLLLN